MANGYEMARKYLKMAQLAARLGLQDSALRYERLAALWIEVA